MTSDAGTTSLPGPLFAKETSALLHSGGQEKGLLCRSCRRAECCRVFRRTSKTGELGKTTTPKNNKLNLHKTTIPKSISAHLAYVAGVSKNLPEIKGTKLGAGECEEELTRRKRNWEGVSKNLSEGNETGRGAPSLACRLQHIWPNVPCLLAVFTTIHYLCRLSSFKKHSLGSLSKRVFETRTATGREHFSF